jgi:hypothetical protein
MGFAVQMQDKNPMKIEGLWHLLLYIVPSK